MTSKYRSPVLTRVKVLQDKSRRFTDNVEEMKMEGDESGDRGANVVTIDRHLLFNALNHVILDQRNEIATAIREVADYLDSTRYTEASIAFNEFLEELQQPQPRLSRLKLFWDGVFNTLPSSATRDDAAAKIAGLF